MSEDEARGYARGVADACALVASEAIVREKLASELEMLPRSQEIDQQGLSNEQFEAACALRDVAESIRALDKSVKAT